MANLFTNKKSFWRPEFRWGLMIFLFLATIIYFVSRVPRERVETQVGSEAPEFAFTLNHQKRQLSEFRGRVVLLNFWASWCQPCMEEMPDLRALEDRLAERGFTLLAVNVSGEPYSATGNLAEAALPTERIHEFVEAHLDDYQIEVIPHSVLIDRDGIIRKVYVGPRKWNETEVVQAIEKFL